MVFYVSGPIVKVLSLKSRHSVLRWWRKPEYTYFEKLQTFGKRTDIKIYYTRICPEQDSKPRGQ